MVMVSSSVPTTCRSWGSSTRCGPPPPEQRSTMCMAPVDSIALARIGTTGGTRLKNSHIQRRYVCRVVWEVCARKWGVYDESIRREKR